MHLDQPSSAHLTALVVVEPTSRTRAEAGLDCWPQDDFPAVDHRMAVPVWEDTTSN